MRAMPTIPAMTIPAVAPPEIDSVAPCLCPGVAVADAELKWDFDVEAVADIADNLEFSADV
jgi:hypothetical protein